MSFISRESPAEETAPLEDEQDSEDSDTASDGSMGSNDSGEIDEGYMLQTGSNVFHSQPVVRRRSAHL